MHKKRRKNDLNISDDLSIKCLSELQNNYINNFALDLKEAKSQRYYSPITYHKMND